MGISGPYFVACLVIGFFIIMNLFVAILLEAFAEEDEEEEAEGEGEGAEKGEAEAEAKGEGGGGGEAEPKTPAADTPAQPGQAGQEQENEASVKAVKTMVAAWEAEDDEQKKGDETMAAEMANEHGLRPMKRPRKDEEEHAGDDEEEPAGGVEEEPDGQEKGENIRE